RTLDEFSISFNSYGAGSIDSIAVYDGSLISELPIPERTNYDFLGWHYEDELLNLPFDYNFGKDIALTAKWEINIEYVISFMTDGGDPLAPLLVHDGDQITELPVPTKYGYWFLGWYHNDQLITAPLTFDYLSDITLTAKWEKANYAAFLRFKNYYENWIIGLTESFVSSQATGNSNGNSEELHYQTHVIEDEGYLITEIWGNNDPLVTVEMSVIEGELIRTTTLHDGLKHVIVTEHLGPAISYGSDYIGEFEESLLHSLNCTNTWMTYQIKGDWSYSAEGTLWEMGQYFAEERLGLTYDQYFELRDLVMTINYSFNDSMDTFRVSFDLEGFYIDDEYWKFDSVETVQKIR
ncbi:MAG: InlB B-repeat-containing protein, partial [Prolixibacteraceae bacterium]|nr:InlB B-repeat-containing protein [Prolixibacteraceae bacterium]